MIKYSETSEFDVNRSEQNRIKFGKKSTERISNIEVFYPILKMLMKSSQEPLLFRDPLDLRIIPNHEKF